MSSLDYTCETFFDKIVNSDWSHFTSIDINFLHINDIKEWTNKFYKYLREKNIKFNWPKSNSYALQSWATYKCRYTCNLEHYNDNIDKLDLYNCDEKKIYIQSMVFAT